MGHLRVAVAALAILLALGIESETGVEDLASSGNAQAGNSSGKPEQKGGKSKTVRLPAEENRGTEGKSDTAARSGRDGTNRGKTSKKMARAEKDHNAMSTISELSDPVSAKSGKGRRGKANKDGESFGAKLEWASSVELSDAEIDSMTSLNMLTQQQKDALLTDKELLYKLSKVSLNRKDMIKFLRVDKGQGKETKAALFENFVDRRTLEKNRIAFDVMAGTIAGLLLSHKTTAGVCILGFQTGGEALLRMLGLHPYFQTRALFFLDHLLSVEKKPSQIDMLDDALHIVSEKNCTMVIALDALRNANFRNAFRNKFMQKVVADVHFVWLHETFGLEQKELARNEKDWNWTPVAADDGSLMNGFSYSQSDYRDSGKGRLIEYKVSLPWTLVDEMKCVVNAPEEDVIQKPIILFDVKEDRTSRVRVVNNGETTFLSLASVLCGENMKTFAHDVLASRDAERFVNKLLGVHEVDEEDEEDGKTLQHLSNEYIS
eukprot:TRINITY_DN2060_c0_g1_i1.p1 TRINITY_DN2060_c0_g1~~TRINITY_DN2060_c0_g1_i1.p1  ORF type:complete len:490 (-),score=83.69 TRINITY_DN2060_c0_g1_i1:102-1571(-)